MPQVPKVLSSRFHATTRGSSPGEPPSKRQRRVGPSSSPSGGTGSPAGAGSGAAEQQWQAEQLKQQRGALAVLRSFPTQQAAFDFWDAQPRAAHLLRTFAVERDASGRRTFMVCAPQRFWSEYCALPHAQRNHYEVGRLGCSGVRWPVAFNSSERSGRCVSVWVCVRVCVCVCVWWSGGHDGGADL